MTKKPLVIRNSADLTKALKRADELRGCTDDSEKERELAEIAEAIEVYSESMRALRAADRHPHQTDKSASDD
jgi:hypothetical protein